MLLIIEIYAVAYWTSWPYPVCQRSLFIYLLQKKLAVGVHTDCPIVGKDSVCKAFRKQFSSKYPIKSLGFPKLWCGLQMERVDDDGSIRISMKTLTEKLLEKFWQGKVNHSYSPLGVLANNKAVVGVNTNSQPSFVANK